MSDFEQSTFRTPPGPSVSGLQNRLAEVVAELQRIDRALETMVQDLPEPDDEFHILKELRAATDCVRRDLLADAVETLEGVSASSPIELWRRFEERRTWLVAAV